MIENSLKKDIFENLKVSSNVNRIQKNNFERLSNLSIGQKGRIIEIKINNKIIKRHLLDMGLTRGAVVEIKKVAPMGDPIDIFLRGYELCIRKADLDDIVVEIIN